MTRRRSSLGARRSALGRRWRARLDVAIPSSTPAAYCFPAIAGAQPTAHAPEWLAYASTGVAALSLLVAIVLGLHARATAGAALEISRRQEARRESRLDLYVNDTASWRTAGGSDRLLGVNLLLTNPSDRETSLTAAEMRMTYAVDGRLATVIIPSSVKPPQELRPGELVPLTLPLRLGANEATSGWLAFFVPAAITVGRAIERYDICVRDLHGVEQSRQLTVFREAPP